MRWLSSLALALTLGSAGAAVAGPFDGFVSPPREFRPESWLHFIGGNLAKDGATADLEAIAAAGISGVQLFQGPSGKPWPGVESPITCLSPAWREMVGHVASEARRLGLTFTMQ